MSIPTINFKSGKVFYKGSSKFRGDLILSHHKKVIEESEDSCNQKSSIYLGVNENRSLEYFDEKNTWNRFRLIKDIKVLKINPKFWNKKLVSKLIRRALKYNPDLKEKLLNVENFGGIINLFEKIIGKNIIDILSCIICLIFGIETTVNEQLEILKNLLSQRDKLDLKDKKKYGWTATPALVKINKTSLLDYLEYYIKNIKSSNKINQRLSYYGFDSIFLLLCCYSNYLGYYYPNIKSVHEDSGEELAIFRANEYIEWIKPVPEFDILYNFSNNMLYKKFKREAHQAAYKLLNNLGNHQIITVESLTGGLIHSTLTNLSINGWNKYGSFVVYNSDAKRVLTSVKAENVYSHECAKEMAIGGLMNSNASISLAVTGDAMPYNEKKESIGNIYIGIATYSNNGCILHDTININICNEIKNLKSKCVNWKYDKNRKKSNKYTRKKGFASYDKTALVSNLIRYKTVELAINYCNEFIEDNKHMILENPEFIVKTMNKNRTDTCNLNKIPKSKFSRKLKYKNISKRRKKLNKRSKKKKESLNN